MKSSTWCWKTNSLHTSCSICWKTNPLLMLNNHATIYPNWNGPNYPYTWEPNSNHQNSVPNLPTHIRNYQGGVVGIQNEIGWSAHSTLGQSFCDELSLVSTFGTDILDQSVVQHSWSGTEFSSSTFTHQVSLSFGLSSFQTP